MRGLSGKRVFITIFFIAIGIHVFASLSLRYHFLNPFFYIAMHSKGQGGCFFGVYQAGVNLLNGKSIYMTQDSIAPGNIAVPFYHFFRYLPFSSYVSALFTKIIAPVPAYWMWVLFNEILIITSVVLTLKLRKRFGDIAIAVSAMWLLFSPVYIELYMGQFCFTMTFCIFLLIYPYLKEKRKTGREIDGVKDSDGLYQTPARDWLPSVSWILSILLKSFTALYTLTLLKMGKKRLAISAAAAVVLTSLPYFMRHPQDLGRFIHLNFHPMPSSTLGGCFGFLMLMREISNSIPFVHQTDMLNIADFDLAVQNIIPAFSIAVIFFVTLIVTIRKKSVNPLASISLWTLAFFLVFKDIWEYHYVMLIPLFVGFYLETKSKYLLVLFSLIAIPTPFVFYDIPESINPQPYWSTPLNIFHHSLKAVPTFLFYLWVLRREINDIKGVRRSDPSPAV